MLFIKLVMDIYSVYHFLYNKYIEYKPHNKNIRVSKYFVKYNFIYLINQYVNTLTGVFISTLKSTLLISSMRCVNKRI